MRTSQKAKLVAIREQARKWVSGGLWLTFAIILVSILSWEGMTTQIILSYFKDPAFVGIFASLLGALVGGILSVYGGLYGQRKQAEAKSIIDRKTTIYIPLYKELIEVRETLSEHHHPPFFEFDSRQPAGVYIPRFSIWEDMKRDNRNIEVPSYLAQGLNEYTKSIKMYLQARDSAANYIETVFNDNAREQLGGEIRIGNETAGNLFLPPIIAKKLTEDPIFRQFLRGRGLDEQSIQQFCSTLYTACSHHPSIEDVHLKYQHSAETLDDVITALRTIIETISRKHEHYKNRL